MAKYIVINGIRIDKDYENFVPETFGRLTTIGPGFMLPVGNKGQYKPHQVCRCECGNVSVCSTNSLHQNKTQSCGCLRKDRTIAAIRRHGESHNSRRSPEFAIYTGMLQRCYNPKNNNYADWGGRGIRVCDRWLEPEGKGLLNFIEDMGRKPSPKHSIDRYPNPDGNYEPGNCRWATATEQCRNRSNTWKVTFNGKTQTLWEWSIELGFNYDTVRQRLKAGEAFETAMDTTPRKRGYKSGRKKS